MFIHSALDCDWPTILLNWMLCYLIEKLRFSSAALQLQVRIELYFSVEASFIYAFIVFAKNANVRVMISDVLKEFVANKTSMDFFLWSYKVATAGYGTAAFKHRYITRVAVVNTSIIKFDENADNGSVTA